eukprot:snap_masked-scaffold_6-processed-gene-13.23-mRNA-1 protein AED:0.09 eAED:1.00 QI:0/-1/0/1/-1/1/1/0/456
MRTKGQFLNEDKYAKKNRSKPKIAFIAILIMAAVFFATLLLYSNSASAGSPSIAELGSESSHLLNLSKEKIVKESDIGAMDILYFGKRFIIRKCTVDEAEYQQKMFHAAKVRGCPPNDDIWLRLVHAIMPTASVFVDIGSNKGYSAVKFFELWAPELKLDPGSWHESLKKSSSVKAVTECGACADCIFNKHNDGFIKLYSRLCEEKAKMTNSPGLRKPLRDATEHICSDLEKTHSVTVHSFDGSKILIDAVQTAIGYRTNKREVRDAWSVELKAFSNEFRPRKGLQFVEDGELGHILDPMDPRIYTPEKKEELKKFKKHRVPVWTIDELFNLKDFKHIDLLKVDAEGHDIFVLEGGTYSFLKSKVTAILFEYNKLWPDTYKGSVQPLGYIVRKMQSLGYICYLEGKNLMVRLSFCWNEAFSFKEWSNVWCVSSREEKGRTIISMFDTYSLAFLQEN